jgi:hypothetical protein
LILPVHGPSRSGAPAAWFGIAAVPRASVSSGFDGPCADRTLDVPTKRRLNFRAVLSGARVDQAECKIKHQLVWKSSTNDRSDLDDHATREVVTFNHNPVNDIPSYGNVHMRPPGMVLGGNVMEKQIGTMDQPNAWDEHSGAGAGVAFSMGGHPNLTKANWVLVGTQFYDVSTDGGTTWNNLLGPFTITRTMAQVGNRYELTMTKTGPGLNLSVGPTVIYDHLSSDAVAQVAPTLPDQTAGWTMARQAIQNANLQRINIVTDTFGLPPAQQTVEYEKTHPNNPAAPGMAVHVLPLASQNMMLTKARQAVAAVRTQMPNMPARVIVTLVEGSGFVPTQQQAFKTNENGGTYRIILRTDKITNTAQHMAGSVPHDIAKGAMTERGKRERYAKAVTTHEMAHMLHAFVSPDKYKVATMSMMNFQDDPTDALNAEKKSISKINTDVMNALNARPYKSRWGYAQNPMQANPAEVVAEVYGALMVGKSVPRGLAAVYISYGGMRGGVIDQRLQSIFVGGIPAINNFQNCLSYIAND